MMKVVDITEIIDLVNKADIIVKMLDECGFYIELGREEEFVNNIFQNRDELLRKRITKELKKINLILHHKYGLI